MNIKPELPEGDIGQLLRSLNRKNGKKRKARKEHPVGDLAARVGGRGRITRRQAVPRAQNIPTGPRDASTVRTWSSRGQSKSSRFVPDTERRYDINMYGMRAYDDFDSGLRRLEDDPDSVILAVHGTCRLVRGVAKAGFGVWVSGFAEQFNRSGLVPYLSEQTSDFAELFACLEALRVIHNLMIIGQNISHVIIKTTSEYLVNGVSDLVWIWASREYTNASGRVRTVLLSILANK
ncbi:hypothetical protein ONS95_010635 [Cadophora gregata]|uniref:uncharacterized protein n=1 Tax=Cadophora gregata TaxID=51156 RepID=UPI0026DD8601|nr:uncharacterized protein ONS95_010635 [Cadophora gregata]KAK0122396.1 hypothetical protein ONS95_010635 [Cadophora gregata]KAK0127875.1 hypothetical protein ONS96_007375 [Cadophora gregata f. sp. sojae]